MLEFLHLWWPWLAIAAIPGCINLYIALQELENRCLSLTFFEPFRSAGFWIWSLVQLFLPSLLFWLDSDFSHQPQAYGSLILRSIVFGFGFVTILNSEAKIGDQTYDIKTRTYKVLVGIAYDLIAAKQTRKAAKFWSDVEVDLENFPTNFEAGLRYLSNYFAEDISSDEEQKKRQSQQIQKAETAIELKTKAEIVKALLRQIRRADLPEALSRLGCKAVLKQYFPQDLRT